MSNRLFPEQSLIPGQSLTSLNGQYQLLLQHDGNLVLYRVGQEAIWSTNTSGQVVSHLLFQTDGNLVLYAPQGVVVWATNSYGIVPAEAIVEDVGNLVVYSKAVAWSSNS